MRFLVLIHSADDRPCSALSNGLDLKARTLNGPEFIASVGTYGAESGAEEWNRASADRRESRLSSHSLNHYRPRTITVHMRRRMALCGGFLRAWLLVAWLPAWLGCLLAPVGNGRQHKEIPWVIRETRSRPALIFSRKILCLGLFLGSLAQIWEYRFTSQEPCRQFDSASNRRHPSPASCGTCRWQKIHPVCKRWASKSFPGILCRMIRWLIVLIRLVVAALKSRRNLLLLN